MQPKWGSLRRCLIALVMALTVAVPSSVQAFSAESNNEEEVANSEVQALLNTRVNAIKEKNKEAFMATIDPQATDAFKSEQSRSFDGWASLPLSTLTITVRLDESGDLADPLGIAKKHSASNAYLPETRIVYRLSDYDNIDAFSTLWLSYVQRDGNWYVASDNDAQVIGLSSDREVWDFGAMSTQRTEHFLVISHESASTRARSLAAIAEEAFSRFDSSWSLSWFKRVPLVVPSSAQEIAAVLTTPTDVSQFSAFAAYEAYHDGGEWRVTAPRLYAQDENLAKMSRNQQVETLVHELVHAATAPFSGPFTPAWQHEGLAEWIRQGKPSSVATPTALERTLPSSDQFNSGNATDVGNAYSLSRSATAFLSRLSGQNAPQDLFVTIGAMKSAPGSSSYNIDQGIRKVTGISQEEFVRRWAQS